MEIHSDLLLMCCKCSSFVEMDSDNCSRLDSAEWNHCNCDEDSCGAVVEGAQRGSYIGSIAGKIGGTRGEQGSWMTLGVEEGVPENRK